VLLAGGNGKDSWFSVQDPGRDHFVVEELAGRTGKGRELWETRLLGDEVRKNQPYFVNI